MSNHVSDPLKRWSVPDLFTWSAQNLGVVEVGSHSRIRIDEPRVDEGDSLARVRRRAVDAPCHDVVEYCIGHGLKAACIVYEAYIGVELAIASLVRARCPNCKQRQCYNKLRERDRCSNELCWSVRAVVFPTLSQFGQEYGSQLR